ncbi:MAG: N-6 DNA methylase, partial [Limnohabitans sp.]|nr:N-6 DNA methylase [Limnohabitans sp.]
MLNIENTRNYLQAFNFKTLFIEELGWSNPTNKNAVSFNTKAGAFFRKAVAELSGAVVFEITTTEGKIPDAHTRSTISLEIQKINFEHILIFVDKDRTQCIWRWLKNQDKKSFSREHIFTKGQNGDLFISKLAGLLVDISEIENNITITDVAKKIKSALDIERVTKKFFKQYQDQFILFLDLIAGIDNEADKRWYASVILNRLMFIYFLQKKMFLDGGNGNYLADKLKTSKTSFGKDMFYTVFLNKLFFEGFAKAEEQRNAETEKIIGKIKYLNGGLFLQHKIEKNYPNIAIPDEAFENLFALFDSYSWTLDDTLGGTDNEINPDVLGYIFEKYINQKAFGAYYTRTEITEYLCEQTIYKLILDEINEPEIDEKTANLAGLKKYKPKRYENIAELLINLDAEHCKKLVVGENAILANLSLLDPACGSGAFLVAAMKTLINVYAAILGKIEFLGDKKLMEWKNDIQKNHPSINYYIKKQIITHNLYGVDIMEEATEIAKLRLFLALVASAQTVEQLEPLPNIDFNIMSGNSLIGLLRVDATNFEKHQSQTLFRKSYADLLREKNTALYMYKNPRGIEDIQVLKDNIDKQRDAALPILNEMLMDEFSNLGIKYEQITWDSAKNKEGKPIKRSVGLHEIENLEPFHWGYDFSEIFRKKDGFDAIITNPPWEVFQTDEKEFFQEYDKQIQKKKLKIHDWQKQMKDLMKDKDIENAWLNYSSKYPFQSNYFKKSEQYKQLLSGKLNLYSIFTLQCFNLLKQNGYCGIVVPGGIYSDLSTSKLRELLFEKTQITGLFCFENRKEIFEGVHRSFKFVVLSFEKDKTTQSFPAAFMRHEVSELIDFPKQGASIISLDFIKKQSPDSFSVPEIKNEMEFSIVEKMLKFPLLSEEVKDAWNIKLGSEFNMTTDSDLFKSSSIKNELPLYEGKMIHQFTHQFASPKYWVNEKEGRIRLLGKKVDDGAIINYQRYRFVHRTLAASTNERTMISSIIPPNTFFSHSLNSSINDICGNDLICIVSLMNSFCLDFYLRLTITTNLTMFFIYQLPVPRL